MLQQNVPKDHNGSYNSVNNFLIQKRTLFMEKVTKGLCTLMFVHGSMNGMTVTSVNR